ncbi:22504_t:CDS:1 [Dentiscutata erythropus]|uniref:22504_t:CDS:1 n=1 Tax=Dentiscutata erythropus TaxID=1348616 RepID=A0A9N9JS58_9GLOM|nr:22504_t:CDS:1 [Dentiscutata erythropus]
MITSRSTQKITDEVIPIHELLEHINIKTYYEQNNKNLKFHTFSLDHTKNSDLNLTKIISLPATSHGLISAIIHAYTLHQHLRISPDDIWLTIAQGVSKHIWLNRECLRHLFVDHEGKKKIEVDARHLLKYKDKVIYGDWLQVIEQLSNAVDRQVKIMDLKQLFECDFSTSTKASITASRIVLLDSTKAYFRCRLRGGCGIPKVTLEGALTDWFHLQDKVNKLRDLGLNLDFWLDRLEPVIAQFIDTYKGNVDERFWNMVVSQIPLSTFETTDRWSGWISSLLPYTKQMRKITNNVIIPDDVPSGLVNVPFEFKLEGGKLHFDLKCSAGFLGARQDIIDGEYIVSSVIGWHIVDQN